MTENEIRRAVEVCLNSNNCDGCPLMDSDLKCGAYFAQYIAEKEKEPAPSANDTSSTKNISHLDNNTFRRICQAHHSADQAVRQMLTAVYENMSDAEQKAFDLGEAFGHMSDVCAELDELKMKGGTDNDN